MTVPGYVRRQPQLHVLALGVLLLLAGALLWFLPYLTRAVRPLAEVPAASRGRAVNGPVLTPGAQLCMDSVTVTPASRLAQFRIRPTAPASSGPPIELTLTGAGYQVRPQAPGGYTSARTELLPILPPGRTLIGQACFLNRGSTEVLLDGNTQPSRASRSAISVKRRHAPGDVALAFVDTRRRSLVDRVGEIFGHASNLTDGLVPVWLIWILAVLLACVVPICTITALYIALRAETVARAA